MERVVGHFGEAADLEQVRRLQEVAQLLLPDVNFAIVHEPIGATEKEGSRSLSLLKKIFPLVYERGSFVSFLF